MATNKPDFREIATTNDGRDITRGYLPHDFLLPPQDKILTLQGDFYETYRDVLQDDQVASCFQQRRTALISKEWTVVPGSEKRAERKAADFIKEVLKNISFDQVMDKMLYGIFYGYSVAECLWIKDGNYVTLDTIKVRDRRRFAFDTQFRLRLLTTHSPNGELLPDKKFWTYCTGADHDDEPYGLGLAHWLYWPVFFKKNGLKFWLIFLEKFGMPTVKGQYDARATEDERKKLLEATQAIQTDSGIILPEGMSIELIEASRSGTADYASLFEQMQGIIAKVILSQTMTTDNGSSYSQSKVHKGVADHVTESDADLTHSSFNKTVVQWLMAWNFPNVIPPKVWRELDDPEDLLARAEREAKIFAMGYKPTLKHIEDVYGGEWESTTPIPTPEIPQQSALIAPLDEPEKPEERPEFSEKEVESLDEIDRFGQTLSDGWKRQMTPIVEPLLETCKNCNSYEEFLKLISDPEFLNKMDSTKFEEEMGNALFMTYLYGRLHNG